MNWNRLLERYQYIHYAESDDLAIKRPELSL